MLVIPAIDIRHGKCVRLVQGQDSQQTVYGDDPVEAGVKWVQQGAKMLHIADLDGAFNGKPGNLDKLTRLKKAVNVPIQIGGGFRSMDSIRAAVSAGADRVILGTVAVSQPELVNEAVAVFGAAIAVSIDVSEDFVAIAGWKELSAVRFEDLARRMVTAGVKHLLFTDTRKDGTLSGPNIAGIKVFLAAAKGSTVTVSGGITEVDDVLALREFESKGLDSIVIGKALYDKRISLQEAIRASGN